MLIATMGMKMFTQKFTYAMVTQTTPCFTSPMYSKYTVTWEAIAIELMQS